MLAWDIIKFLQKHGEPSIKLGNIEENYDYFFDIINSGQTVLIHDDKGELAAAALYVKVRNLNEIHRKRGTPIRLRNYRHGNIVYVHTLVVRPDYRKRNAIWNISKKLRERELLCDTIAYTINKEEKWNYKVERRREKMRDNCGIIALDALLKSLDMNMTRISLDTLSKICRDNGKLMFPLRVQKNKLGTLPFPYIIQNNNHYEVIEDEVALEGAELKEDVYVLYPSLNSTVIPYVIDEEEAKDIKGAGDDFKLSRVPIVGPYLSKPARLLPLAASAGATMLGAPGWLSNVAGIGTGAIQGGTTGLWGEPGAGSMLSGGLQGFGQGMLGRGIGYGLGATNLPIVGNRISAAGNVTQPSMWDAFREGFGQSIPFGQKLGLYQPGAALLTPSVKAGQISPAAYAKYIGTAAPAAAAAGAGGIPPMGTAATRTGMTIPSLATGAMAPAGSSAALTQAATQQAAKQAFDWSSLVPSAALMLGGMAIPQPEYDVPDYADTYKQMISSQSIPSVSGPLGAAAQAATLRNIESPDTILQTQTDDYKNAIISDLNRREQEEISFVRTMHSQNGTSGGSDEMRDVQNVQAKYRDYQMQQLGAIEQNLYNQKVTIYLQSIADAYQMDRANLEAIAGLTDMSIYEASVKYGIKAQQVKDFRDAIFELARSAAPGAQSTTAASLLGKMLTVK